MAIINTEDPENPKLKQREESQASCSGSNRETHSQETKSSPQQPSSPVEVSCSNQSQGKIDQKKIWEIVNETKHTCEQHQHQLLKQSKERMCEYQEKNAKGIRIPSILTKIVKDCCNIYNFHNTASATVEMAHWGFGSDEETLLRYRNSRVPILGEAKELLETCFVELEGGVPLFDFLDGET